MVVLHSKNDHARPLDQPKDGLRRGVTFLHHGSRLREAETQEILLDADSTEDPTHGQQQLALFHGKYGTYMYQPLLIFEGRTGYLLASRLRPGTVPDAEGILPELKRLVPQLRKRFPKAPIRFRADAGFSAPGLYDHLEAESIDYLIGIPAHTCFEPWLTPLLERAKQRFADTGEPVRIFSSFRYRARRWPRRRRILVKVEVNPLGTNVRCVITNRHGRAGELFALYQGRGEVENRIDELKNGLKADRLSCSRYRANAFRLQLHSLAYNLMNFLHHALRGTHLARAETSTLRLKLFKIAARVHVSTRRIWFHLSSSWPLRSLFYEALEAVRRCEPLPTYAPGRPSTTLPAEIMGKVCLESENQPSSLCSTKQVLASRPFSRHRNRQPIAREVPWPEKPLKTVRFMNNPG